MQCFLLVSLSLLSLSHTVVVAEANFEDTRCRCVCPSTAYFNVNQTDENGRRLYTMTNINPSDCTPLNVVKDEVSSMVNQSHINAFLANCDCRYESRNTVMLKVVVIFVICVVMLLVTYMGFLMCLDPMLRKQRFTVPYRQQNEEMEDNIFARAAEASSGEVVGSPSTTMRSRNPNNVLERVEAEQNRWMKKVEEQRKKIFTDHTMLN